MPLVRDPDQNSQSQETAPREARARVKRIPTLKLTAGIILIAFALSWLGDIAVESVLVQPYLGIAKQAIVMMLFFALGWVGVITVIRREFYQVIVIRGRLAVIIGVVLAGVCWSLSLRLLWNIGLEILQLFSSG